MKSYILNIIPKIQKFSKKLDDNSNLIGHHWVLFNDSLSETKIVFIFRTNNELLIVKNGIVEKSKWEHLDNESIILETKENSFLLKHGFLDDKILVLKRDSFNDYSIFINESKVNQEFNSIEDVVEFLSNNYLLDNVNDITIESKINYLNPQLSYIEKRKVDRIAPMLKRGQVITKHKLSGKIEIMTLKHYSEWIRYYGNDMLILIAKKE